MRWPFSRARASAAAFRRRTQQRHRSRMYGATFRNSRLQQLHRERWKTRLRVLLTITLALGSVSALAWVVYLLFFSTSLTVQHLEIDLPQKQRTVTEEQLENALVPLLGQHLARIDVRAVEAQVLSALPRLRSVEVKKMPPGTIRVTGWEYGRLGIVRQPLAGMSYTVNENGRVIERAAEQRASDLSFIIMTTEPYALDQLIFDPEHLTYLQGFLSDLRASLTWEADTITYDPLAEEMRVKILRGPELLISLKKAQKETLQDLLDAMRTPQLRDRPILYIDLRLPNGRVLYRLG